MELGGHESSLPLDTRTFSRKHSNTRTGRWGPFGRDPVHRQADTDEHAERVASELQEGAQKFFASAGREQTNASLDAGLDLDVVPTGEFTSLSRSEDEPYTLKSRGAAEEERDTFRGRTCVSWSEGSRQTGVVAKHSQQILPRRRVGQGGRLRPLQSEKGTGMGKRQDTRHRYGEVTLHRTTFEVDWNDENAAVQNDRQTAS